MAAMEFGPVGLLIVYWTSSVPPGVANLKVTFFKLQVEEAEYKRV
jgi:hypothetical protein